MLNFLHIPKCGGSTVRNYIRDRFSEEIRNNPDASSIFVYGDQWKIGTINLKTLNDDVMRNIDIGNRYLLGVVGHYNYSGLKLLLKNKMNTYGNTFSLVRDPVDRVISNLNYMKSLPEHLGFKFASQINQISLTEYLLSHAKTGGENYQCNILGAEISPGDKVTAEQINSTIFKNINVYKVENTTLALNNHVISVTDNFSLKKKNVTSEITTKEGVDCEIQLLDRSLITLSDEQMLRNAFANDYLLYDLSR